MDAALATGGAVLAAAGASYFLLKQLCPWVLADLQYLRRMGPGLRQFNGWENSGTIAIDVYEQMVKKRGDATLLLFDDRKYSYNVSMSRVPVIISDNFHNGFHQTRSI